MNLKKLGIRFGIISIVVFSIYAVAFGVPAYMDQRGKDRQNKFNGLQSSLQEHLLLLNQIAAAKTADAPPSSYEIDNMITNLKNGSDVLSKNLKSPDKRLDADTIALLRSIPATTGTLQQDYRDAQKIVGKAAAYYPENDLRGSDEQKKTRADAATNALKQIRGNLQNPSREFIQSLDDSIGCLGAVRDGATDKAAVDRCSNSYKETRYLAVSYMLASIETEPLNKVQSTIKTVQQKVFSNKK